MGGGGLPVQVQAGPVIGEQPGRQGPVPGGLGVPDRLHRVPVHREPGGGGLVQRGDLLRSGATQLQLQQVGEQVVVAEPRPPRIQRHHERVRLLQVLQHPLPAAAPGQQVGQLPVDPVQDGGAQQQQPHRLALPVQHLGQQVLRHRPLGAGKLLSEPPRIRLPGQRQRCQPQPRRPPLSPLHQQRHLGQLSAYRRGRICGRWRPSCSSGPPEAGRSPVRSGVLRRLRARPAAGGSHCPRPAWHQHSDAVSHHGTQPGSLQPGGRCRGGPGAALRPARH